MEYLKSGCLYRESVLCLPRCDLSDWGMSICKCTEVGMPQSSNRNVEHLIHLVILVFESVVNLILGVLFFQI